MYPSQLVKFNNDAWTPHDGQTADRIFNIEKGNQATIKTIKTIPRTFIARRSLVVSVPPLNACTAFLTSVLWRNERWVFVVTIEVLSDGILDRRKRKKD